MTVGANSNGSTMREWGDKLVGGVVLVLALTGLYHLFFSSEDKRPAAQAASAPAPVPNQAATAASLEAPAAPPQPVHFYSLHQDGQYGYEQGISENDEKSGVITKPLMMVRYLGKKGAEHLVEMRDDGARFVFSCEDPCEFVRTRAFVAGEVVKENTVKNTPGSVMNAIMLDAMAGQLEPYSRPKRVQEDAGT